MAKWDRLTDPRMRALRLSFCSSRNDRKHSSGQLSGSSRSNPSLSDQLPDSLVSILCLGSVAFASTTHPGDLFRITSKLSSGGVSFWPLQPRYVWMC